MKILVVDCCIRGDESRTRKLYERFLETVNEEWTVEILDLNKADLRPLNNADINERDMLVKKGETNHPMFRYANAFKEADKIIIAAPYWDLSFPSLLKVYLEHISVTGVTFGYEGTEAVGYCKAESLLYLSTCGGYIGESHMGADYVKAVAAMLGIDTFKAFTVEGLDIDPSKAEDILKTGMERMIKETL
ncbi:MAG: hypothetical protein EOM34_06190 [Clostridia bacterium]|nr:NAD(P)H-dependent oxidoreductase [Lachnospiraceae bacterium]NCC00253.1 hypothetical protein [Clostridia bacterium]NCD02277.1 hypothetical protein [Clostridia bacterium]